MKVLFPRNIDKGMFNIKFAIGPFSISVIQMTLIAAGVGVAMGIYRGTGGGAVGALLAIPVLGIFIGIAFFNVSELALHAYIAKLIRTNFLDSPTKFQVNYNHMDPRVVAIKRARSSSGEQTEVMDYKDKFDASVELQKKMEDQSNFI